jgi:hypothetical protein
MKNIKKFRRVWLRHRKLPQMYPKGTTRRNPTEQYVYELRTSLASWSKSELGSLLEAFGIQPLPLAYSRLGQARELVSDLFECMPDGTCANPKIVEYLHENS